MKIVYIYDIFAKNKKEFNRIKRNFYYHLGKLPLKKENWKTKSTFAVELASEKIYDEFFKNYKKNIKIYKILATEIEEL